MSRRRRIVPSAGSTRIPAQRGNCLGTIILSCLIVVLSISSLYLSFTSFDVLLPYTSLAKMPSPSELLRPLFQTRTLLIALALLNLKSLPFAWHLRLLYHWLRNIRRRKPSPAGLVPSPLSLRSSLPHRPHHPLFTYSILRTRAPLLETDYNLHKSNATYFLDLDASRTQHVTRIVSSAFPGLSNYLRRHEGYSGTLGFLLGSVHTSFRKEIRPYEAYEVWTRIVSWDRKWIVLGSWFVRRRKVKGKRTGDELEVAACALSKYVVKIGRRTVEVERCFREAGWLPERTREEEQKGQEESAVLIPDNGDQSSSGEEKGGTFTPTGESNKIEITCETKSADVTGQSSSSKQWTWHDVEAERVRGMAIAENWLKLDTDLLEEFETF